MEERIDRHVGDGSGATRGFPVGPFGFAGHWFSTGQSEPVDAMDGSELASYRGGPTRSRSIYAVALYKYFFSASHCRSVVASGYHKRCSQDPCDFCAAGRSPGC